MEIVNPGNDGQTPGGVLVIDSSDASFVADVIEGSQKIPVIVDFWAPWCGPCKQLGPILEKVVGEANGAVKLVKLDIDQNPQVAQQLRVQSIPAVFAFYQGRPIDGFQGALPESQIKAFVKKLTDAAGSTQSSPIDDAIAQASTLLDSGDFQQAEVLLEQVMQHAPENDEAKIMLARAAFASGHQEKVQMLIDELPEDKKGSPEILSIISSLALKEKAKAAGDIDSLKNKLASHPADNQARFDLALALFASDLKSDAIDELLEILKLDRMWNEEAARVQLLEFFEALGPTNELTIIGRRKLSSLLFS